MRRVWVAAFALLLGCAPAARAPRAPAKPLQPDPEAKVERLAGDIIGEMLEGEHGPYADPALAAYVGRVGRRITKVAAAPGVAWRFRITDDPEVDARALPGGRIVISRAALACLGSEAELAAVLAHEVAHVTLRHASLGRFTLPKRSSPESSELEDLLDADQERQADALAVRYLGRAGYQPRAVGRALDALRRSVVLECTEQTGARDCATLHDESDPHPPWPTRLARVALVADDTGGEEGRARYLQRIDGLVFGDGRDAPRFVNGRFEAAGGPSIALPKEARAELSGAVLTSSGLGPNIVIMRAHGPFYRRMLLAALQKSTFSIREVSRWRAVIGSFGAAGEDEGARAALLDAAPFIYLIAVAGAGDGSEKLLEQLLASVRPASPAPASVRVLRVVTAAERSSLRQLCPSTPPALASALNGWSEDANVPSGTPVKCIVGPH